jgi:DtxR family transcriptional regulator, Mn-dependent transcriptional regulator
MLDIYGRSKDNIPMSESTEMYLSTIIRLRSSRGEPLPLSALANALSIASVSANEMCRKLQEQGLVIYRPYKGVTLTEAGERRGRAVLRRRGLWIVFLTQKLGLEPAYAREVADALEHGTPDDVAERLSDFLGNPRATPLGNPIPSTDTTVAYPVAHPLTKIPTGGIGHVVALPGNAGIRDFLQSHGLQVGTPVQVLGITDSGERLLRIGAAAADARSADARSADARSADAPSINLAAAIVAQIMAIPQEDVLDVAEGVCEEPREAPPPINVIPLSRLQKGEIGVIVRLNSRGALRQRLLDMGVVTGEEIQLKHRAPLGDPLEFTLKGYQISLRKAEAAEIMVEVAACK